MRQSITSYEIILLLPRDITAYSIIPNWKTSGDILTEWALYVNSSFPVSEVFDLEMYWESKKTKYPILYSLAKSYIWLSGSGADVERSFSLLEKKQLEGKQRLNMIDQTVKDLLICYCNPPYVKIYFQAPSFKNRKALKGRFLNIKQQKMRYIAAVKW